MKSALPVVIFLTHVTIAMSPANGLLWAQVSQPGRYEKEQKFNDDDFIVVSLEEEGIALIREKNKYKAGNQTWELILLDTALQEKQVIDFEVDQRKAFIGHERSPGFFYLLFKYGESPRVILDLFAFNIKSGEIKKYEIKPELGLQLTHFSKIEDNFVFAGYVNNEPAILLYNTTQDNIKVLPGFFQKETELVELNANKNNSFNIILVDRHQRDNRKIVFKTYDSNGLELLEDIISIDEKRSLQSGIVSSLVREDMIILGTWGGMSSKQSAGFYAIPVDPFSDQKIQYTAFGQLTHFLDHLKPNRAESIREKTKADMQDGRIPDYVNYTMPFKIVEHPEGFLLLTEVFTPSSTFNRYPDNYPAGSYPSYPYPYYNPYWGYYPSTYNRVYNPLYASGSNVRNSEDVKISKTVLIAFDENGKVKWDHSLELDNIRRNSLEQVADFCHAGSKIYFLYKKESELKIKTITLENSEAEELTEKIKLLNTTDELRMERERDGVVRFWFGNCFYVWGNQTIRNKANQENATRQVFYINKIMVH